MGTTTLPSPFPARAARRLTSGAAAILSLPLLLAPLPTLAQSPPEPQCTEEDMRPMFLRDTSRPCWIEISNQPGCYRWTSELYPRPGTTVTWSGGCIDGRASGKGEEEWDGYMGAQSATGELRGGREHGHWVWRSRFGSDYEGSYVNGERRGHWVGRSPDGDVYEGPFVDGREHGHWVMRDADGGGWEGPFVKGERDGWWAKRGSGGREWDCFDRDEQIDDSACLSDSEYRRVRTLGKVIARIGPGEAYERLHRYDSISAGYALRSTGRIGAWLQIAGGGYIHSSLLEEEEEEEEAGRAADATPGEMFRDCDACPEMVVMAGGAFLMGSRGERGSQGDELPRHEVTIAPFAVGRHEVTRGEYARYVEESGASSGGGCWTSEEEKYEARADRSWRNPGHDQRDDDPAVCVSWEDAKGYVAWLARETGAKYRLLSEAEWEYAARAGGAATYYWGNWGSGDDDGSDMMTRGPAVKSSDVTPLGLHAILGGAWEWVEDCWHDDYQGAPSDGSAWGSENDGNCERRVLRGGPPGDGPYNAGIVSSLSLVDEAFEIPRPANRSWHVADFRNAENGFRVARTLD